LTRALKSYSCVAALLFFYCCLFVCPGVQEETQEYQIWVYDNEGNEIDLYQDSYALVIGIDDYTGGWPKLPGVKEDIAEVEDILTKHGFKVTVVRNPDRREFVQAVESFISRCGREPGNRLLFYFAGHGHTVRLAYGGEMGYIVPKEAPNPNIDKEGFLDIAIDMRRFDSFARSIESKHVLFIFDSCFSGSIFALSRAVPEVISYKTSRPVRQFITSGSADEVVPDESIFKSQFIEGVKGEADVNNDGYVTGTELGEFLQNKVVNYSAGNQHPQYGKIRDPLLDKGDFVFIIDTDKWEAQEKALQIEIQLDRARSTLRNGNFDNAVQIAKRVLDVDPENDEAGKIMNSALIKVAPVKIKSLVDEYAQSLESEKLLDFYKDYCQADLYSHIEADAELTVNSFHSLKSHISDIEMSYEETVGCLLMKASFAQVLIGVSREKGTRQALFEGTVHWDLECDAGRWQIQNIVYRTEGKERRTLLERKNEINSRD